MCFLVDDTESDGVSQGDNSGSAKLQLRRHHTWLIPRRILMVIFGVALILCIVGMIFMAIGGGIKSTGLHVTGGILFAFGVIGLIICLIVCLYAYFVYGTKDQSVQTEITWTDEYMADAPGYASIGRPSALKSADSTLKRNGLAGQKKVTMAPEIGPYGESPPSVVPGTNIESRQRAQLGTNPSFGSGTVYFGDTTDPRGVGGRSVAGVDVGTGGIRINTLDRNQPFPSPGSQGTYGGGQFYSGAGSGQSGYGAGHAAYSGAGSGQSGYGAGHAIYSGGGGSSVSSSVEANYAYPKSASLQSGQESGYNETSGSQYSTLRSIPVTHVVHDSQKHHQDNVEYARINKQSKSMHSSASEISQQKGGYLVQGHGYSHSQGQVSPHYEQKFPAAGDDFDYDNPVERTPMISPKPYSNSYHEQQMQFQRQQQHHDLHAPRQLNTHSMQRQTASNPYHNYQDHQEQYQSSTSSFQNESHDELPDLQPLVYPSARRPMTFEQVSSSKMSVYDNVLAGLKDADDE